MSETGEATHQRVVWFYQRFKEDALELAPPFQRKPVWSMNNKSFLIDTIINGLPIPEIYMQIKIDKDGKTKYVIIDGQQRLRAVLEYLDGEYEILEEHNQKYAGKEFKDLPDGIRQDVWNYRFVVRELSNPSDEDIRNIFQRLNKNVVPLNRQELRNATYIGHFIHLSSELADDNYWSEQGMVSPADIRRMVDVEFVSELLIALLHGIQPKEPDLLDKFYKLYDDEFPEKDNIKNKFIRVKTRIEEIFGELRPTRWRYKLDYYGLFVAVSELIDNYYFPPERYDEIKDKFEEFARNIANENLTNQYIREYYEAQLTRRANKENRNIRVKNIKNMLIPFLIAKDTKRNFNEEERRIFFELSQDKICAICGRVVDWENYELDHKTPHSKGGKTELQNAQITCKSCNASKGNN